MLPAADPTAAPVLVRARARADVEYSRRPLGRPLRRPHQPRRPGLPRDDGAARPARASGPSCSPTCPAAGSRPAEPFAGHLVLHEWSDAQPKVRVLFPDGRQQALDFGAEPHDLELGANPEWDTTSLRVSYQSLTTPASVYDVDVVTGERIAAQADADARRRPRPATCRRGRGRRRPTARAVPVDVVRHVDTPLDGTAPGVVYGYGSYEVSMPPWFSVARLSLLDRGVVWALVHPRGGGELGRRWYLDGKLLNKRNTFTDTLAADRAPRRRGLRRSAARRHPRRERRRAARRRVHHDAPRAVRAPPSPRCRSSTS